MQDLNHKGLLVYRYECGQGKNVDFRFCIADPSRKPYPYECKGETVASGFKTQALAVGYIDRVGAAA